MNDRHPIFRRCSRGLALVAAMALAGCSVGGDGDSAKTSAQQAPPAGAVFGRIPQLVQRVEPSVVASRRGRVRPAARARAR